MVLLEKNAGLNSMALPEALKLFKLPALFAPSKMKWVNKLAL